MRLYIVLFRHWLCSSTIRFIRNIYPIDDFTDILSAKYTIAHVLEADIGGGWIVKELTVEPEIFRFNTAAVPEAQSLIKSIATQLR